MCSLAFLGCAGLGVWRMGVKVSHTLREGSIPRLAGLTEAVSSREYIAGQGRTGAGQTHTHTHGDRIL